MNFLLNSIEIITAIIFGLCFGSFLNVLILRIPRGESIAFPASHCFACGKKLRFYHNIPLLSFIFLRGKCAFCGAKIAIQYPLIEAISGIIALFIYLKFGFSIESICIGIAILLLLALSVIDFRFSEVPDCLNFSAFIFAIIGGIFWHKDFLFVIGSAFAYAGFFTLLRFAFQSFAKKEALGEGDIIIAATIAAILGWQVAFVVIFLGAVFSIIPLLMLGKNAKIPFIPFLYAGLLVCLFGYEFVKSFLKNYPI